MEGGGWRSGGGSGKRKRVKEVEGRVDEATRVSVGLCTRWGLKFGDGAGGGGEEGGGGRAREGPKGVGHLFPSRTA